MVSRSFERCSAAVRQSFARLCVPAAVVLACVFVSGCATRQPHNYQAGYSSGGYDRATAQANPYWRQREASSPRVAGYVDARAEREIEDDGLPAQAAPRLRAKPEPDDPSQPFSPNYGRVIPSRSAGVAAEGTAAGAGARSRDGMASIPEDLPPAFRRQIADAAR